MSNYFTPYEAAVAARKSWDREPSPYTLRRVPGESFPVVFAVRQGEQVLGHLTLTAEGCSYSERLGTPGLADAISRVREALAALRGEGL